MIAVDGHVCTSTVALRALGCLVRPDGLFSCWEIRSGCGCTARRRCLHQYWRDDRTLCSSRRPLLSFRWLEACQGAGEAMSPCSSRLPAFWWGYLSMLVGDRDCVGGALQGRCRVQDDTGGCVG
jgi:hypothetical protein